MKIIFLGTPEFAIPTLEALLNTNWINVIAICTQTDKEAGRGKQITSPPVKKLALEKEIQIFQTKRISKEKEIIEKLKELKPDIFISCSYGQILSQEILDIAQVINVHASLLPKYRGAAPINWAILNGEKETGISIMKTELSLDTGPIILQEKCTIGENETSVELFEKLSKLGAKTLIKALELIKDGKATYTKQDDSKATFAPMLKKEQGKINWNKTSFEIHNQVRGLQPWPSAYTTYQGRTIKIWECGRNETGRWGDGETGNGTIVEITDHVKIKTSNGSIDIYKLQEENKKIINSKDWINGSHVKTGDKFE